MLRTVHAGMNRNIISETFEINMINMQVFFSSLISEFSLV